jgi:HEPN domain-containing protein
MMEKENEHAAETARGLLSVLKTASQQNYRDAKAYHRRALQFLEAEYADSLVFNVAAVALERYLVAICEWNGVEPMNHNFIGLMKEVDTLTDIPHEISRDVRSLDRIFGICSLDDYYHGNPEAADRDKVLRLCGEMRTLCHNL